MTDTTRVDPRREVVIGKVLGFNSEQARSAVAVLSRRGWLHHGIATVCCAAAARWGVDVPEAARELAAGREIGDEFSDYELRSASAEAEMELDAHWTALSAPDSAALRAELAATHGDVAVAVPGSASYVGLAG